MGILDSQKTQSLFEIIFKDMPFNIKPIAI
jgi:hypothetical protein